MVLSDRDIKKFLKLGKIKITPPPNLAEQLGSCSLDLHLSNTFMIFEHIKHPFLDPLKGIPAEVMKEIVIPKNEAFIMRPGEFVLAATEEIIQLGDDIMARIEGRSSLGRLGIAIHSTASIFDPGWIGKATMELGNLGNMPVALYPGMRICSFTFEILSSPAEIPYYRKRKAKYLHQEKPGVSRISQEFKKRPRRIPPFFRKRRDLRDKQK